MLRPLAVANVKLSLLGGFELLAPGGRPISFRRRKTAAALAFLARRPSRRAARDTIAALLSSDDSAAQARHSLRQTALDLRTALRQTGAVAFEGDVLALSDRVVH